mgnify:CR=1 FL=1
MGTREMQTIYIRAQRKVPVPYVYGQVARSGTNICTVRGGKVVEVAKIWREVKIWREEKIWREVTFVWREVKIWRETGPPTDDGWTTPTTQHHRPTIPMHTPYPYPYRTPDIP